MDIRKSGYYWVKLPANYGWQIGCYTAIDELWSFFVTKHEYTDDLLLEIDEKEIIREIMEENEKLDEQISGTAEGNYWKERCLLAEKCLKTSPCDPDITDEQMGAQSEYNEYLTMKGYR
tara:strand:- start:2033 stop:2389 length:357 start_codon:yes stop_codon:yes gene_type:complete